MKELVLPMNQKVKTIKPRSFTLIELLVSISIFSVIAVVLYSAFRGGVVSWRRINTDLVTSQKVYYIRDTLEKDFRNMVFLYNLPLKGTTDKIEFVSLTDSQDGSGTKLARIVYCLSADNDDLSKTAITRTEEPLNIALGVWEEEDHPEDTKSIRIERLPGIVADLKFNYMLASKEEGESGGIKYEWLDAWAEEGLLPMGISIEFTVYFPEYDRSVKISRRIYIPTGSVKENQPTVSDQTVHQVS